MLVTTLQFRQKGVSLVELLIVVVIIAALAAIAIPRIVESSYNAKCKTCGRNIEIINTSIELYKAEKGAYPLNLDLITGDRAYFPEGAPICPITDAKYPAALKGNRVDASGHNH